MSKKIVILGCENYHARQFLTYIKENEKFKDVEVLGVHSLLDKPAEEKLANDFGAKRLNLYTDCVDQVDGVIVTARNGNYHYQFAEKYLKSGITAYIDKPITITEDDAIKLANLAKKNNVKLTGQSSLLFEPAIKELKEIKEEKGCIGGFVRAPISMDNPHGGFYFYAEHLVDMLLDIFGWYPKSVFAREYEGSISVTFKYEGYDVLGLFSKDSYFYSAGVFTKEGSILKDIPIVGNEKSFEDHFEEFYDAMNADTFKVDYHKFISPVFVLNAIERSMQSGKEEEIRSYSIDG